MNLFSLCNLVIFSVGGAFAMAPVPQAKFDYVDNRTDKKFTVLIDKKAIAQIPAKSHEPRLSARIPLNERSRETTPPTYLYYGKVELVDPEEGDGFIIELFIPKTITPASNIECWLSYRKTGALYGTLIRTPTISGSQLEANKQAIYHVNVTIDPVLKDSEIDFTVGFF
jgi:hypothetical protein